MLIIAHIVIIIQIYEQLNSINLLPFLYKTYLKTWLLRLSWLFILEDIFGTKLVDALIEFMHDFTEASVQRHIMTVVQHGMQRVACNNTA